MGRARARIADAAEGVTVTMGEVVDAVVERAAARWGPVERHDVSGAAADARVGPSALTIKARKPEWLRVKANMATPR